MASIYREQEEGTDPDGRVAFLLVGHDDSEEARLEYLLESGIPFPGVVADPDEAVKPYLSMAGSATGSLPHIALYRSDGTLLGEGGDPKIVNQIARLVRGEDKPGD